MLARALQAERALVTTPWPRLNAMIQPSRGALVIVLGAPGVGKSAMGLTWALHTSPSLLVSLDTDLRTQAARTVALLAAVDVAAVLSRPQPWIQFLRKRNPALRFVDRPLTAIEVGDAVSAETDFYGEAPALTVVDNVGNLTMKDGEYADFKMAFHRLHRVARQTNTCVAALHHVKRGEASNGTVVPNLSSGLYGGESEAELVLGLARPRPDLLRVAVLKNRWGRSSPAGDEYIDLSCDISRMAIR